MEEIKNTIDIIEDTNPNVDVGILHCVLSYPTDYSDANLLMIKNLKDTFPDYEIGYSDHTKPDNQMLTLITSYLYGACIIEKHFTLDKSLKGNDHYHAMDPDDVRTFKENIKFVKTINGQYNKEPLECEKQSRIQARRSIVAARDILKGKSIVKDDLTFKRPGSGISPDKIDSVLGKTAIMDIKADDILDENMFE